MCLSMIVTLPQAKQIDAALIAEKSSTDEIKAYKEKRLFGRTPRYLFIASGVGNCACDLLTDNADWDAETWDIIPSYLPHISSVISNLYQHLSEGFLFEALWAGDSPTVRKEVSIAEMVQIIQNNKIETKTTYQVTSADGEKLGGLAGQAFRPAR
jgi:hypothetical protein